MHSCYFYLGSMHHIFVPFRSTKNILLLHWEWALKIFPIGFLFLLAKYLYNCSKFLSSFLSYQFCSSYKRLVIYFLCKKREEKQKQKKKMDKGPNKKKRKKERKIFMQPSFHLFSKFRREKLFPSMEHCRIRFSPLSFYLIYSPSC
jgi:hypothetical protein